MKSYLLLTVTLIGMTVISAQAQDAKLLEELGLPPLRSTVEPRTSEDRTYVALFGGASVDQNTSGRVDLNPTLAGLGVFNFNDDTDLGYAAGMKVGRTFSRFSLGGSEKPAPEQFHFLGAVEGELFYNKFGTDGEVEDDFPAGAVTTASTDINMVVTSFNGVLRAQYKWFRPYIGLGIGFAYLWTDNAELTIVNPVPPPGPANLQQSSEDIVMAAQGLAGVEFQLAEDWGLLLEYKYLYLHDPTLKNGGFAIDFDYIGQSFVSAGLKFYLP
ncbi:MAG: outer membrane beta-barrel protein [Blastochloris sp.]|nr:outer membrane beta-barrel protein [Blastochloris sp.]